MNVNHRHGEETEFAGHRFPQRLARDVSYYYPGRHYRPEHRFPWRGALCFAGFAVIWLVLYLGV